MDTISFDDFIKVNMRVGKVIKAEKLEKSNKLLCLSIDMGTEVRQILSGIAKYYSPEELIDKHVIVVVNLAPREIMGYKSEGMVLAADDNGKPSLLSTLEGVPPGCQIT